MQARFTDDDLRKHLNQGLSSREIADRLSAQLDAEISPDMIRMRIMRLRDQGEDIATLPRGGTLVRWSHEADLGPMAPKDRNSSLLKELRCFENRADGRDVSPAWRSRNERWVSARLAEGRLVDYNALDGPFLRIALPEEEGRLWAHSRHAGKRKPP